MSMVTLRVNDILKNLALPNKNLRFDILIDSTKEKFFDFDFPWYSADNKGLEEFKTLFLQKYMMYEIGFETFELFKLYLCNHLSLNMERWKMLYDVISRDFDVLSNYNTNDSYKEIRTLDRSNKKESSGTVSNNGTNTSNGTIENNTTGNSQSIHSDNPQVNFSGADYASAMDRGEDVATSSSTTNNSVTSSNNTESSGKESNTANDSENRTYDKNLSGYSGITPYAIIDEFSRAVINLNKEIVDSCENLFLGVW